MKSLLLALALVTPAAHAAPDLADVRTEDLVNELADRGMSCQKGDDNDLPSATLGFRCFPQTGQLASWMSISLKSFNGETDGSNDSTFRTYDECQAELARVERFNGKQFKGRLEIAVCATNYRIRLETFSFSSRGKIQHNESYQSSLEACLRTAAEINAKAGL
jgi:hypothetical protein